MSEDMTMRVAVPTDAPGGTEAARSGHFGHADCFTVLDVQDGAVVSAAVVENPHDQGGCLAPVAMLAGIDVDAIVVGGIGGRPLMAFRQAGVRVVLDRESATAGAAVLRLIEGGSVDLGDDDACGGHGEGGCHGS